jgi:hypothetical protein
MAALLCLPAPATHAQVGAQVGEKLTNCLEYAGFSALPSLQRAHMFSPEGGYAPYGWGPLAQPYGAGPIGPLTAYSPPGLIAAYGPLGPGPTAFNLANALIPPGGFGFSNQNLNNVVTTQVALGLAGVQQGELGTLYGRYGLGAAYQIAGGTWALALSGRAASTFAVLLGLCLSQEAPQQPSPGMAPASQPSSPGMAPAPQLPSPGMAPAQPPGY